MPPKKNRPYIDFINQSKPWHQPVTQPKQATNHESIHPKPQQKKSTTWLLSHPFPSRHDLKISFFTQQPPLWHDVQLLNYIDGLASAWTSAVVFQRVPAVYWDPQVGSNSFQLGIDGCPDCSVLPSNPRIQLDFQLEKLPEILVILVLSIAKMRKQWMICHGRAWSLGKWGKKIAGQTLGVLQ